MNPVRVTIYRRPTTNGDLFRQISGLDFPSPSEGEGGSFTVPAALLRDAGIGPPKQGDQIMDDAGIWYTVSADEEPNDTGYTVSVE